MQRAIADVDEPTQIRRVRRYAVALVVHRDRAETACGDGGGGAGVGY